MIALRPAASRGTTHSAGSTIRHSFSYGDYHDPSHMGCGALRVINEIELAPGASIASERRANIELLDFVVAGELKDASVATGVLRAGDLHCLSAGSGSEDGGLANASSDQPARALQVWIQPDRLNAPPRRSRTSSGGPDGVALLASAGGRDGAMPIRQDIDVHVVRLRAGERATHAVRLGRRVWLQVTAGSVAINGVQATVGDGVVAINERALGIAADDDSELLMFGMRA